MFSCFSVSLGAPTIFSLVFLYLQSVLVPGTAGQVIVVVCVWSCQTSPEVQEKEPKGCSLVHFLGLLTQNKGSNKQHHCPNLARSVLRVQGIFHRSGPNSLWLTRCVTTHTSAGTQLCSWCSRGCSRGCSCAGLPMPCPSRRVKLLQPPTGSHPRNLPSPSRAFCIPPLLSSRHHQRGFSVLWWVCSQ